MIPPRFIWKEGHFRGNSDRDFRIWVTSGEATPGNYEERHYELPTSIAAQSEPDHPEDWPKSLKDGASSSSSSSWGWGGGSKRDSLPWGLRIRCPGCGHFFKENDLKDHVNSACPAKQGDMVMWIIECECHPGDLLAATKILEGFPYQSSAVNPGQTSGGSQNGGDNEDGRGAEPAGKAGTAA